MHCNWGIFSWTHSLSQQFLGFLSAWCQWNLWPMRKLVSHSYVLISLLQDHSFEIWAYYYGQHLVSSWIDMLFIWMKFLTIIWQLICVNKSDAHLFWNVFIILNFKAKHLHGDELFFLPFIQSSAAPEASPERAEESFCYTYSIARQEVCRKFVRVYDFNIDSDSMKFLHWWHGNEYFGIAFKIHALLCFIPRADALTAFISGMAVTAFSAMAMISSMLSGTAFSL